METWRQFFNSWQWRAFQDWCLEEARLQTEVLSELSPLREQERLIKAQAVKALLERLASRGFEEELADWGTGNQ